MNSEENFKKSLQDKIESKEFVFDEKEWDKAAAIIDASKKGNNRGFIYFISAALILILGYLSVNLNSTLTSPNKKLSAAISNDLKSNAPLVAEKEINSTAPTTSKITKTEALTKPAPSDIKTRQEELTTKKTSLVDEKENTKQQSNPVLVYAPHPESGSIATQEIKPATSTQTIETSFSNPIKTSYSGSQIQKTTVLPSIASIDPKEITASASNVPPVPVNSKETTTSSVNSKDSSSVIQEETIAATPSTSVIPASTLVTSPASDSTSKTSPNPYSIHNILNFEVGTAYMFGWKNDAGRDANGFTPVIGINYLSNVISNYWFSIGLQYTSVHNLSYSSKTSKVTRYKLGEESDVTTITPSTLHYLSFPFKLQYQFNEKNSFGAAYTLNYLFNVESKVETYTQKLYGTENHQSYTSGGYTEGFKLFSSQVGLFYRRELIKDLWINADLVFGLNDTKENSFFNMNTIERNSGIKLTLTYNLFKH